MDELLEEIEYEITLLIKSGFYDNEEINEIIEEQFIDENLNKYKINNIINNKNIEYEKSINKENLEYFNKLEQTFNILTEKHEIVCIHNAGFEFEEGVNDAIEIYTHLFNNKYTPKGFVFYTFTDIEYAIETNELFLSFGDYKQDKNLALTIGKQIKKTLEENNLTVIWDENIDEQIQIKPFNWMKKFDETKTYEMEGSVDSYIKLHETP